MRNYPPCASSMDEKGMITWVFVCLCALRNHTNESPKVNPHVMVYRFHFFLTNIRANHTNRSTSSERWKQFNYYTASIDKSLSKSAIEALAVGSDKETVLRKLSPVPQGGLWSDILHISLCRRTRYAWSGIAVSSHNPWKRFSLKE